MTTPETAHDYGRYSPRPGEPDEIMSNEKQREVCQAHIAAKGYQPGQHFADEALTGVDDELDPDPVRAVWKRPGLLAAMDATKKNCVLVVRWRSRIARDPYVLGWVRRTINKQGGRLEFTDESNEAGLAGELLENAIATIDKYKAIQTRLDTKRAMLKHQNRDGRRMGRLDRCPWGFKPDLDSENNKRGKPGRLVVDPDEKETSRIILACHARGGGPTSICRYLDKIGRPRRGKTWAPGGRGMVQAIIDRADASKKKVEQQPTQKHDGENHAIPIEE